MIIETLSQEECVAVLSANHTASLACVRDSRPYVVPISYAVSGSFIYSFSQEGKKLDWMRDNKTVSLLVLEHGSRSEWKSVVVNGTFGEFTADSYFDNENDFAWKALNKRANWWEPGSLKPTDQQNPGSIDYTYYSVLIEEVTGRSARVEP